jgi:hypothetical protein
MTFKSFPVTLITTHMARAAGEFGAGRLGYTMALLAGTTALGAIAVQAKRIATGKEPLPMDDPKFLVASVVQGGGLGIIGDFVFMDHNRYGSSAIATLAGPVAADFEKYIVRFMFGSAQSFFELDHDKFMDRMRRIPGAVVKDLTPGQLWYTRLLMERYLFDFINRETDPRWSARIQQQESKMNRDQGAGFWWKPGGTPQPGRIELEF